MSGMLPKVAKKLNLPGTGDLQSGAAASNTANQADYNKRYGSLEGLAGGAIQKGAKSIKGILGL